MKRLLANAAEALRNVAGGSFEGEVPTAEVPTAEVSVGEASGEDVSGGEGSVERAEWGGGGTPRAAGLLTVQRGFDRWDFRALEVGRLTKERAAQLLKFHWPRPGART